MSTFAVEISSAVFLGLFDVGSMFVIALLAVLLFGGDLPKMGRKFGKFYSEFQRNVGAFKSEVSSVMNDITSEINDPSSSRSSVARSSGASPAKKSALVKDEDEIEASAPKFEPPKK